MQTNCNMKKIILTIFGALAAAGTLGATEELRKNGITGEKVDCINIVGGGSQDTYLNSLTEKYTGKENITGPVEATAMGNLKTQINYLTK